ncbi:coiled-coil domain-containing protein 82 [Clupea harengus]|uniref:Coiled-coil domain-containing protein 82 n=1 Tax=Clupea harengus TaxID=7950 RepID=A0A6P3WA81_CLUHA|nr:coiled-coil domain-containing protein 82 [Clupea harengus]
MFKNWGKRNKYGTAPKRVESTKTRQPFLDDSDEESLASTTSVSCSESEFDPSGSDTSNDSDTKRKSSDNSGDSSESEEKVVSRTSRKRSSTSATALNDSSSDSDSDVEVPVRKIDKTKRFKRIKTDEDTKQTDAKRRERQRKLAELVERRKKGVSRSRRRRASSEESEADEPKNPKEASDKQKDEEKKEESEEDPAPPTMVRSSDEDSVSENDSLKDFIVEEEGKADKNDGEDTEKTDVLSQLPSEFITRSPLIHFQVVVKSLLINVLDENFLKSLYDGERTKRYALEMKESLHYFDERLVLPRLENLKLRSRWKERYKERVECYPEVRVKLTQSGRRCEACELDRTGRFSVVLSGQLYHAKTLEEDQFMPEDKQSFCVGSVCANRTEVYHALKHFKYHLFVGCRTVIEEHAKKIKDGEHGAEEEAVKETVKKVFASLLQNGWINEQYDSLQEHLNKADFFQEEKLD